MQPLHGTCLNRLTLIGAAIVTLIFSVDYPFADNRRAHDWFDRLELTADVRQKVAHATADTLLGLHRCRNWGP